MVMIEDIAHALSMQCRFAGHCRYFYSVAEHSCLVSSLLPSDLALKGLLHDAAEAYVTDIPTPLKNQLFSFKKIEDKISLVIFEAFGLELDQDEYNDIKFADAQALKIEANILVNTPHIDNWTDRLPDCQNTELGLWGPSMAKAVFLDKFYSLMNLKEKAA